MKVDHFCLNEGESTAITEVAEVSPSLMVLTIGGGHYVPRANDVVSAGNCIRKCNP